MTVQLIALAVLAALSMSLYIPLNGAPWPARESRLLRRIPLVPAFIVPYLGFFPFVAFSMLAVLLITPIAARLYVSLIFGGLVAALIWYFIPTGTSDRPEVAPRGILTRIVSLVYRFDSAGNALPSSHAYNSIICSYYLAYIFPLHEVSIWACGAAIVGSTIFVKQHHVSDLIAGGALAAVSIGFSYLILGGI